MWAWPKLCQRLFPIGFRRTVFGPETASFLAVFGQFGAAVPLRFPVLKPRLWGLVFGARSAQPSPAQPTAHPKPWCGPCQSSAKGFFLFSAPRRHRFWSVFGQFGAAMPLRFPVLKPRLWGLVFGARSAQPSPAQPTAQPKPWCGPCQSSAKGFFLLDSDAPFSAPRRHRFWSVFGQFGAAMPLRFPVLKPRLWCLVFGARSAQPSPAQPTAQPTAQPKPWCGPCQSSAKGFFLLGFRRTVFGYRGASLLVRLGPPCRCVSPSGRVGSEATPKPSPAQFNLPAPTLLSGSAAPLNYNHNK